MKKYLFFLLTALLLSWSANAQMVLVFDTNLSEGTTITLPLYGTVDVTVNWGDGASDTYTATGNHSHAYTPEGTYTVSITGSLTQFGATYANSANMDKLVRVTSFGDIGLTSLKGAFWKATNLVELPSELPSTITNLGQMLFGASKFDGNIGSWNVNNVTDMQYMFCSATKFNQDISSWVVSNVTNMNTMFSGAKAFNQNIGSWNVGKVTDMSGMFEGAIAFNQDISGWNVSKVNNMTRMFSGAKAFNQDINGWIVSNVTDMESMFSGATAFNGNIAEWNVSKVTNMSLMFAYTSFNQNISDWKVSEVTNMNSMFSRAYAFNQNIGEWDVKKVTNMKSMFSEATAFNQDIGEWKVSNVTDMTDMFKGATSFNKNINNWDVSNVTKTTRMFNGAKAFNQNIGGWNVSKVTKMDEMFSWAESFNQHIGEWNVSNVTDMGSMFYAAKIFNQDIGRWNVSNVTYMGTMFAEAYAFNQDISDWNVSKATNMWRMFMSATAFNQNIGDWDVTSVTSNMSEMFQNVTLSTSNYNKILIGWAGKIVKNGVNFGGGNSKYSPGEAAAARAVLTGTYNWIITDGGESNIPAVSTVAPSSITSTSATSGGDITNDGGSAVTARGVVWDSTKNPTIATNAGKTTDGAGVGTFASSITGLSQETTYYVRAYATNANGTEYGENREFKTKKELTITGTFTANSKTYDGTAAATINQNSLTLSGIIPELSDVSIGSVTLAFSSKDVATDKTVSIASIELAGADAHLYSVNLTAAPTATATITPEKFTVTFTVTNENGPLTGATIMINAKTLTTNTSGIATIELENGVYPYSVSGSDYVASNGTITVDGAAIAKSISLIHVGINTNLLSNMNVYPNPFKNELHISNASNVSLVVITNIMGQVVLTVNLNQASNQVVKTNLPSGVYLITVIANNGSKVVRRMIRD